MKKFLFILILMIMLPFVLCSCGSQKENNEDVILDERFVIIENYVSWANNSYSRIIVDKETKVIYYKYSDYYKGHYVSGITVLYNADGTPMIYDGEL